MQGKVIEEGGVLSIPVEELRIINSPRPNHSGHVDFGKKAQGGRERQIESYPVCQTVEHLNAIILAKYNEVKVKAKNSGKSPAQAEREATSEAIRLPQFQAVKAWQDTNAEIKLKKINHEDDF